MRRTWLFALLGAWGCATPEEPPRSVFRPGLRLVVENDRTVEEFARTRATEETQSLSLNLRSSSAGFEHLQKLNGLQALELAGFKGSEPIRQDEAGRFYFRAVLTDEQVGHLARIPTLRELRIWYGSLSEKQHALLKAQLPKCLVLENLNKI